MSAAQHTANAHDGHGHDDHGHDDHHGDVGPHSTFSGYMVGFVLSIILTAIPFWLVMAKVIADRNTAILVLGGFAVVQILVHMVCFLHMNGKVEGGWTLLSTIFTVVFVAIAISGTLWVMFHMNANMMPGHPTPTPPTQSEAGAAASHHTP
ncbi:cytochrome o ubiquinol oxidase subunit IV [Acidovorax sp. LjRoot118]|uniref:cytochrome o ubiquinol oxidase subunit IV n=1 Tax=Acidovorax sp. LjRoot118 TaxID=3342256 RepID=UPI003ECC7AAF